MHRIDHPTLSPNENGAGKDGFTQGNPGTEAATTVTDDWLNDTQEEIANTIEDAGLTLVKGTQDQLSTTIKRYLSSTCASNWSDVIALTSFAGTVNAIAYGNGYFVAVGDAGDMVYSLDGLAWYANDQGANDLNGVYYDNGYWVAVGASGTLYYATDPTGAWTSNTQGSSRFDDVYYGNGYWVAVGSSGTLYYATDPTGSWTSNTQGSTNFYGVHYGNGYWVAVGASGALYYKATNPTSSWTSNTQGSAVLSRLFYADGYWMVAGQSGTFLYHAADPTGTWSANSPDTAAINGLVAWNTCIVVADSAGSIYINGTVDGTWIVVQDTTDGYESMCYGNGRLLVGTDNAEVIASLQSPFC